MPGIETPSVPRSRLSNGGQQQAGDAFAQSTFIHKIVWWPRKETPREPTANARRPGQCNREACGEAGKAVSAGGNKLVYARKTLPRFFLCIGPHPTLEGENGMGAGDTAVILLTIAGSACLLPHMRGNCPIESICGHTSFVLSAANV